jgi:fibronectin type 3 domain-containing protein
VDEDNQVFLQWNEPTDPGNPPHSLSYKVYRGTNKGGPYTNIGSTKRLFFLDTTFEKGMVYYYVVSAVGFTESQFSNEVKCVVTQPVDPDTTPLTILVGLLALISIYLCKGKNKRPRF